jgi:catechol 2,3-dioxygenase-like lactoylglutathione lyase family enzyme
MQTPPLTIPPINIKSVAGVATISPDPANSLAFFVGLGIPFQADDDGYHYTTELDGIKHFGIWPLADAALSCFGTTEWPAEHPVPQATIEFEVPDVEQAVQSLLAAGYTLLHGTRLEEWGQTTARLQSPEGLVVGAVITPEPAGE